MKILVSADSPTVSTGFGIVSRNLLNRWYEMGHEIQILAINHYGDPYDQKLFPYPIYPVDKGSPEQLYGYGKFWALEERFKPDLIFFLNDPWIIARFLQERRNTPRVPYQKVVAYYPTDGGPIKPEWIKVLNELDAQVCYSNYAERVVIESNKGKRPKNLHQIYHGVDTNIFKPVNQSQARAKLGIPLDSFVVGMVARNQPRKRFDIMVKGFAEFAKNKDDVKLYLHTSIQDVGFDIVDLVEQFDLGGKLIFTEGLTPAQGVPDEILNLIYNSFDVNCLISMGDGFGLPVAESMAVGCPQIVSGHSCLQELVEDHGGLTVKTASWVLNPGGINTWGGMSDPHDLAMKLDTLYTNREFRINLAQQAIDFITTEQFTWDFSAGAFNDIFKQLFHIL